MRKTCLLLLLGIPLLIAAAPLQGNCFTLHEKYCCFVLFGHNNGSNTECSSAEGDWACQFTNQFTANHLVPRCSECPDGGANCRDECFDNATQPQSPPVCKGYYYECGASPGVPCTKKVVEQLCKVQSLHGMECFP